MRYFLGLAALALVLHLPLAPSQAADDPKQPKLEDNKGAIPLLSSPDKAKRLAATLELFARDAKALDDLKKAGAKHMAEDAGTTITTKRIHVVYSLIAGFPEKPTVQFLTDSFGLHVEEGVTREDMVEMGKRHGFEVGDFHADSRPNCYVKITKRRNLPLMLREILSKEADVISVNLNYFENSRSG